LYYNKNLTIFTLIKEIKSICNEFLIMKHYKNFVIILFMIFSVINYSFDQVDVIYNDLVWSDEFDTNGPLNSTNWYHQTQLPAGGSWYNGEEQHYTNRIENSFIDNGNLNIVAIKESFTNQGYTKQFTSARLNSKFAFKYGRVDIRAKVPKNKGSWPAFWMLGKNINEPGGYFSSEFGTSNWPACGETDIMEYGIFPSSPENFIKSTLHTPSSFGASVNQGGMLASSDISSDFHIYSMNWSPNQITFLLDGIAYYTYNPAIKDNSTWPFNAEQYLLLNIAMGGVAGTIPSDFTQATMTIDYVRVYQNVLPDNEIPFNFEASIGTVSNSSVELLLKSSDNSGSIEYIVNYGSLSSTFVGYSDIQKSAIITGLLPNTNYNFTVTAKDLAGNEAINNPILLSSTTTIESTLVCEGTANSAQQGSFTTGYNYNFTTQGTDVNITFTLLDTDKVGVVAYLWRQNPFGEIPMTQLSGNTFSHTINGQTVGETINYGVKFAYSGGMSVSSYYSYVVGSTCTSGIEKIDKKVEFYFQNPTKEFLEIKSDKKINGIELYDTRGALVLKNTSSTQKYDINKLEHGIYQLIIFIDDARYTEKINCKLILSALKNKYINIFHFL
jgi:beta-glucanase (GH16 family)